MVKRPAVPLIVLMIVTVASLGIIAVNPPSFDMDQNSFQPDNDITRAADVITESFTATVPVVSLIDTGAGGNIFEKAAFISILEYERSLAAMRFTDSSGVDGNSYTDLSLFRIYSPVSAVAKAITGIQSPAEDPSIDMVAYYDDLILLMDTVSTEDIKAAAYAVFNAGFDGMKLTAFLSTEHSIASPAEMSAKGCMVTVVVIESDLIHIQNGLLGLERDVIHEARTFSMERDHGLSVKAAGFATTVNDIGTLAQRDITTLLPIAIAVIIALLFLIYRDVADTLIGLLGLLTAVIWTFGASTLLGIEITTIAIAVPILIMALGIDYSLHLVFRYREERQLGANAGEAIGRTMGSVGEALTLATVTTAIAFLSYLTSAMSALADFGLMCAIGIVCAFLVMLLLVPPTQTLRGRHEEKKGKEFKHNKKTDAAKNDALGRISGIGGRMAAKRPAAVLGTVALVIVLFGYSATNLSYSFNMYDFIPEGTDASETLRYLDDNFSATTDTTDVLIYADAWNLDTLRAIERSVRNMESERIAGLTYFEGRAYVEHLGTALRDLDRMLEVNTEATTIYPLFHLSFITLFN
ncbi:MAG: MMPL family transporter, partial [Methanomassiliicoccaceae archaeon]|nr:MMPL family transporter [Methanomassiliicoccaceae archaeon]